MKITALRVPKGLKDFSQSQMSDFAMCRQKWLFRVNGLANPLTEAATSFGTVFHYLLQCLYRRGKVASAEQLAVTESWLAEFQKENKDLNAQEMENDCAVAGTVFQKYLERYGKIDFDRKEYFMSETVIRDPKTCRYAKLDAAFTDFSERVYVMENKTRSRIDEEKLILLLAIDFQNLTHVTLMDTFLKKKKTCNGVIYNIVRKPQLKRGKDETLGEYCQRIAADIDTRPDFYFIRQEITYSASDKKNFLDREVAGLTKEMTDVCQGTAKVYRNTNACQTAYGACDYLEACSSGNVDCLVNRTITRKE